MAIEIVIEPGGRAVSLYDDAFDFTALGEVQIRRASSVEPDEQGRWVADLAPVQGPKLGPFVKRQAALDAEVLWLNQHWLGRRSGER